MICSGALGIGADARGSRHQQTARARRRVSVAIALDPPVTPPLAVNVAVPTNRIRGRWSGATTHPEGRVTAMEEIRATIL